MITKEMWGTKILDGDSADRYFSICSESIPADEEGENHHILPRSMFPEYDKCSWNIVRLSYINHYKVHEILASICINKSDEFKMLHAWNLICNTRDGLFIDADTYNSLKTRRVELLSENMSGAGNPMYGVSGENAPCFGRVGEKHPMFGRNHLPETIERIKASSSGENHWAYGIRGENHPLFGYRHSEESIKKMCEKQKGKVVSDETKEKLRVARTGKKLSQDTKDKIRTASSGRKHSDASKEKMCYVQGKWSYLRYSDSGELLEVYRTLEDLRRGGFTNSIRNVFQIGLKHYAGFRWLRIPKLLDESAVEDCYADDRYKAYAEPIDSTQPKDV